MFKNVLERIRASKQYERFDDNVVWYLWDKPKDIYKSIRSWFWYSWNKPHLKLVKGAFLSMPWDGYYIDEIVWLKLEQQYNYFKTRPGYCSEEKMDEILRWLSLACKLAYIVCHESELWDGEGDVFDGTWHSWSKVNVNLRNKNRYAYRYVDYKNNNKIGYSDVMYEHDPWELYRQKARKLLYKILYEKGEEWWD